MNSMVGPIIGIVCVGLFALVFIVVGVVLIMRSRSDKAKLQESRSWPSVDGTVLESSVVKTTSNDDEAGADLYRPYVKYAYEAGGNPYTNDKLSLGMVYSSSNPRKAQETVARYPAGRAVKVFVNPANPSESTLEQKGSAMASLVIGIILLVIGLCAGIPGAIAMLVSLFNVTSSSGI